MVTDQEKFFAALGLRIRRLRERAGYSQEDMISHGFSARHWQQIEKGRPITLRTLLRICRVFRIPMARLVRGLDAYMHEFKPSAEVPDCGGQYRARLVSGGGLSLSCRYGYQFI